MPGWSNLTLVTDADLAAIEPQCRANMDPPPWGATTWPSARAEAKRELKILIELAYPEVKGAADKILDQFAPDWAFSYIASAYADITSAIRDDTEDDVDLTTIFASSANRIYVGADYQFEGLYLLLKDALNAQARTLTVKYRSGSGWTALTIVDGTAVGAATFAQSGRVTWTIPSDWTRQRWAGTADEYFWVELSVDAALSSGSTKAAQILPIRAPDGLKRAACYLALGYILNGLELQAGKPEDWQAKSGAYRQQALDLFNLLKERGGIPLDVNHDQVVTQAEVQDTRPIRLGRA